MSPNCQTIGWRFLKRAFACLIAYLIAPGAHAQYGTNGIDWPYYGGDAGSTKYAPATQINASTLHDLEIEWTWASPDTEARSSFECTPLAIGGKLYVVTARNRVVRLDGVTGLPDWTFDPAIVDNSSNPPMRHRGCAYWTDGVKRRIVYATEDDDLISLDADTGALDLTFGGGDGKVDLAAGIPRLAAGAAGNDQIGHTSPPIIYQNVAIIGNAIADTSILADNPPGYIRGYNVETGALVWTFKTVPDNTGPDSSGVARAGTWEDNSWSNRGHANAWAPLSLDADAGIVYLPTSCATGNYDGSARHGDNEYSTSILALDALTGAYVWHFQLVHHDIWDFDTPAAPNLIDIVVDRGSGPESIKALAQITKQGYVYVFNRLTGEPVWPIVETAVPTMPVIAGEQPAPTQPIPTLPPPFVQLGITTNDLNDATPAIKSAAQDFIENTLGFALPIEHFRPPVAGLPLMPVQSGAGNWPGGPVDPTTGRLYVNSLGKQLYTISPPTGATLQAQFQTLDGGSHRLFKGSYNDITAIDLNEGDFDWQVPNGFWNGDPALPGIPGYSFSMLMGDLLFYGGRDTTFFKKMVVIDKNDGSVLREIPLPNSMGANPMTYRGADGFQYVTVALGSSGSQTHRLVSFRLQTLPVVLSSFEVE